MKRKGHDNDGAGELLEKELTGVVMGAFYETYNILDFGFLESVYRCVSDELSARGLQVQHETPIEFSTRESALAGYRLDLLVERRLAVEVKATLLLHPTDKRQLLNYLRATSLDVGLLLHYGPAPEVHRLLCPRYDRAAGSG